jgi:hypothetical protein
MPSKYYCHSCAIRLGHVTPITTSSPDLTGNSYLFSKYLKHTMPTNYGGVLSIFDRPEYSQYQGYTVTGSLSGKWIMVDASIDARTGQTSFGMLASMSA